MWEKWARRRKGLSLSHLKSTDLWQEPPYIYLQWMLAETCGVHMAEFKTQFATLPQVLSRGLGIDVV